MAVGWLMMERGKCDGGEGNVMEREEQRLMEG